MDSIQEKALKMALSSILYVQVKNFQFSLKIVPLV
jgi:hypothetical protein